MDSVDRFHQIVAAIYDAALQPELWPTALQSVSDSLHCDLFHAFVWDVAEQRQLIGWATPSPETAAMHDAYSLHFGRIDPRRTVAEALAPGEVFRCHDHIDARAVDASEFYQDFLLPFGLRYMIGSTLMRTSRHQISLALLRAKGRPEFTDAEAAWARLLVPHLQRASTLLLRQAQAIDLVRAEDEALDRWDTGVALLDDHGAVLHLNASAKSLVDSAPGLRLVGGRLVAQDAQAADAFVAALHQLHVDGQSRDVLIPGRTPIVVTLCRAPSATVAGPTKDGGVRCWAFIAPLARRRLPEAARLVALFKLTPAEARLARAIAAGHSLAEAASECGVKPSTVRSQMLAVLAKTGARRQQELAAMLSRLP